jgi:hypothetical protein
VNHSSDGRWIVLAVGRGTRYVLAGIAIILVVLLFPYYTTTIHVFEEGKPFSGDYIYNPYDGITGGWQRGYFQTHDNSWTTLSIGSRKNPEVVTAYQHGRNLRGTRQLVLDAHESLKYDFWLYQGLNQKQSMIESLVLKSGGHVVLTRKEGKKGYRLKDLSYLTGYTFLDFLDLQEAHPAYWDEALGSGKLCWMLAHDNGPEISLEAEQLRSWNMILADTSTQEEVINSLTRGAHYCVHSPGGTPPNFLYSVSVDSQEVSVSLRHPADSILVIGLGGMVRAKGLETSRYTFRFFAEDPYLRIVAYNGEGSLWLNPLIRYNGRKPPLTAHSGVPVNYWLSGVHAVLIAVLQIGLLQLFLTMVGGRFLFRRIYWRWPVLPRKANINA